MDACIITSNAANAHVAHTASELQTRFTGVLMRDAVDPQQIDDTSMSQLSAYSRFVLLGCGSRHDHVHFDNTSAFAALLAHKSAMTLCAARKTPLLILEDNASIVDWSELEECRDAFLHHGMHFLQCHAKDAKSMLPCRHRAKNAPSVLFRTSNSVVLASVWPMLSLKCYMISPFFARHMLTLMESRIENIHIDWWVTLEASHVYGTLPFGASGFYQGDICRRKKLKTRRINHSPVVSGNALVPHILKFVSDFVPFIDL